VSIIDFHSISANLLSSSFAFANLSWHLINALSQSALDTRY